MTAPHRAALAGLRRPARYGAVGLACAAVTFTVILVAKDGLGLGDVPANLAGYALGYVLGFALNGRWTFGYRGRWAPAFGRHLAAAALAYAANLAVVAVAAHRAGLDGLAPHLLGAPAYTVVLYLLSRHVVFRSPARNPARSPGLSPAASPGAASG